MIWLILNPMFHNWSMGFFEKGSVASLCRA